MLKPECVENVVHSKIKLDDKKSKRILIIENPSKHTLSKVRFDGCVVMQSTAADWLISQEKVGDFIVELKGSDVDHAVLQVQAVAKYLTDNNLRQGKLGAMVLCTRYPRVDSKILRARNQFAKIYSGPLHVTSHDARVNFEDIISKQTATISPHK